MSEVENPNAKYGKRGQNSLKNRTSYSIRDREIVEYYNSSPFMTLEKVAKKYNMTYTNVHRIVKKFNDEMPQVVAQEIRAKELQKLDWQEKKLIEAFENGEINAVQLSKALIPIATRRAGWTGADMNDSLKTQAATMNAASNAVKTRAQDIIKVIDYAFERMNLPWEYRKDFPEHFAEALSVYDLDNMSESTDVDTVEGEWEE